MTCNSNRICVDVNNLKADNAVIIDKSVDIP